MYHHCLPSFILKLHEITQNRYNLDNYSFIAGHLGFFLSKHQFIFTKEKLLPWYLQKKEIIEI